MFDFAEARTRMVDNQLRTNDVTDLAVLAAMGSTPREAFVTPAKKPFAYIDEDVAIADGRYLMKPHVLARLVQLAEPAPSDLVLVVGAGTGYAAAILARLAGSVVALEVEPSLADRATDLLQTLGHDNVAVVTGPLAAGYPNEGPYDLVFVDGAVEVLPDAFGAQLKDGGRMVVIVGEGRAAEARLYTRSAGSVAGRYAFNAAAKPLPGFAAAPQFAF